MTLRAQVFLMLCVISFTVVAGSYELPACHQEIARTSCGPRGDTTYGLEYLFLKPSNGDLILRSAVSSGSRVQMVARPEYGLSFRLMVERTIGKNVDAALNWLHSKVDSQQVFQLSSTTQMLGGTSFNFDQFNGELGDRIDFTPRLNVRVHAGVSYTSLKHNLQNHTIASSLTSDYITDTHSYWHGFGPRAGVESSYLISGPWDVIVAASGGLYAGTLETDHDIERVLRSTGQVAEVLEEVDLHGGRVIPGGDAKIGLRYTHDSRHVHASVEFGYMIEALLHSIAHIRVTPVAVAHAAHTGHGAAPVDPDLVNLTISNYGLHGPYITFRMLLY